MKKIISFSLAILMIAVLMAPVLAASSKIGSKVANPTATVKGKSSKGVKIDGAIGEYEYEEIPYTVDNLRYEGKDDAYLAQIMKYSMKMYACWDSAKLYLAVVVDTPSFVQTQEAAKMYHEECIQVACAKVDEKGAETRNELGFSKNSSTGALMFNAWSSVYDFKWTPKTDGSEFQVVTKSGKTTYEMAIPCGAFGSASFKQGDRIGLNVCICVGSDKVGDKKNGQIEYSIGTGDGKDATKYAKITLGEAIAVPVATTTAATTKAAATSAAKAATTAAKTADASVIIAAVAVVALAGITVCKKKH